MLVIGVPFRKDGTMGSISRGFRLARASWWVVKKDRELLWLPLISFLCSLVVVAVFGLGMLGIGLPEKGSSPSPGIYVLGFVMYVALSFVTIYFNAAVIGTATKRLRGEDAKISDGLALARQHIGKIFVWALITATVGMILSSASGARRPARSNRARPRRDRVERADVLRGAGPALRARRCRCVHQALRPDLQGALG